MHTAKTAMRCPVRNLLWAVWRTVCPVPLCALYGLHLGIYLQATPAHIVLAAIRGIAITHDFNVVWLHTHDFARLGVCECATYIYKCRLPCAKELNELFRARIGESVKFSLATLR